MSAAPKLNISAAAAAEDADDEASPSPSHSQLLPVLSKAIEDFGLELLHRLESKELDQREKTGADPKNLFISPLSLSTVLGVVLVGAAGDTYREIKRALG